MSKPKPTEKQDEAPPTATDAQSPSPLSFDYEGFDERVNCLFAQQAIATLCQRVLDEFEVCFPRPPGPTYEPLRKALHDLTEFCNRPGFDEHNPALRAIVKRLVGEDAYASLRHGDAPEFALAFRTYAATHKSEVQKRWEKFAAGLKRIREENKSNATALKSEVERERLLRAPEPVRLSERQKCIMEALDGAALTADKLAEVTGYSRRSLFKSPGLNELRELGLVRNLDGFGYFRPDRPPPEVAEALKRGWY